MLIFITLRSIDDNTCSVFMNDTTLNEALIIGRKFTKNNNFTRHDIEIRPINEEISYILFWDGVKNKHERRYRTGGIII